MPVTNLNIITYFKSARSMFDGLCERLFKKCDNSDCNTGKKSEFQTAVFHPKLHVSMKFKVLKLREFCDLSNHVLKIPHSMSFHGEKSTFMEKGSKIVFPDNMAIPTLRKI